jgi:hypothetical protein
MAALLASDRRVESRANPAPIGPAPSVCNDPAEEDVDSFFVGWGGGDVMTDTGDCDEDVMFAVFLVLAVALDAVEDVEVVVVVFSCPLPPTRFGN